MKIFLYILLGLSLGSGLTLIAIQERFIRERRRLLAMGESQRAKASEIAEAALNKQWEQKFLQQAAELEAIQAQLAAAAALGPRTEPPLESIVEPTPTPSAADHAECVPRGEYVGLITKYDQLIHEKNTELTRLATENQTISNHLASHQEEINDLHGQITFLEGQIARLEEEKKHLPDDDFLVLGQAGGHLLPGSVVRAFIKGHPGTT